MPMLIGMPSVPTMVMLVGAAVACGIVWRMTSDGMARWRRRRALRLLVSAPTHSRLRVSVGQVEDSIVTGRWCQMMRIVYTPERSEPRRFWTLGSEYPPRLVLVTYDLSRAGAVRDVVSVSARSLCEHGWDFS